MSTYDRYYRGPGLRASNFLRLRHEHGGADDFTWIGDGVQGGLPNRQEIEVSTEPEIHGILSRLRYEVTNHIRAVAMRYRRDLALADIVEVDGLGTFLELQTAQEESAKPGGNQRLDEEARLLGLGRHDFVPEAYLDLLRRTAMRKK